MKTEKSPFEDALLDAVLEKFKDVPESEEDIDFTFSPEFLERADRLLEEGGRKHPHRFGRTARRILLAAAIIVLLAATAMAVPAIRKAILGFFVTDTGPDLRFTFDAAIVENAPDYISTVYHPSYIPEGYIPEEDYNMVAVGMVCLAWNKSPDEVWLTFLQEPLPEDFQKSGLDGDVDRIEYKDLDAYEVLCTYSKEATTYCWTNYDYLFTIIAPSSLPEEEVQKIFYSVQIDPNAVIEGIEYFE